MIRREWLGSAGYVKVATADRFVILTIHDGSETAEFVLDRGSDGADQVAILADVIGFAQTLLTEPGGSTKP